VQVGRLWGNGSCRPGKMNPHARLPRSETILIFDVVSEGGLEPLPHHRSPPPMTSFSQLSRGATDKHTTGEHPWTDHIAIISQIALRRARFSRRKSQERRLGQGSGMLGFDRLT
jgi:hypothetical protein